MNNGKKKKVKNEKQKTKTKTKTKTKRDREIKAKRAYWTGSVGFVWPKIYYVLWMVEWKGKETSCLQSRRTRFSLSLSQCKLKVLGSVSWSFPFEVGPKLLLLLTSKILYSFFYFILCESHILGSVFFYSLLLYALSSESFSVFLCCREWILKLGFWWVWGCFFLFFLFDNA